VNVYSQGEFSYGKTAIFFAATQSRVDVMEYLLARENAKVTIVNNKGQSVRSIAASHHMPLSVMERIEELEIQQQDDWWNFRATHSDGLEYGDLDPRFLDRPLRPEDVVTPLAVNPTTKETRKGGFARRNPEIAKEQMERLLKQQEKQQQRLQKKDDSKHGLTANEKNHWEETWDQLTKCLSAENVVTEIPQAATAHVMGIIHLGNRHRQPWIPHAADRLLNIMKGDKDIASLILTKCQEMTEDDRIIELLGKIRSKIYGENIEMKISEQKRSRDRESKHCKLIAVQADAWEKASQQVQHLSIKDLECNNRAFKCGPTTYLTLPRSPVLVDTIDSLQDLKDEVFTRHNQSNLEQPFLIAVDAEWYDVLGENGAVHSALSTVQLAFCERDNKSIFSFVVDLTIQHDQYRQSAQELVRWILRTKNLLVLGFALAHDIHMLQAFVIGSMDEIVDTKCTLVDIQQLLSTGGKATLPGLKFSYVPLSKSEQCSEWGTRPLRPSQVEYAGLDAAILLVLLSEHRRHQVSTD
jgi:3'-5' exonuclease